MVEGRLQLDTWENQQGEKRSKLRVVAQRVQFLGSAPREKTEERESEAKERLPGVGAQTEEDIGEDDIPF